MSEFVTCLNTSTIKPTPLLQKIAIAGSAGYEAIEPWNDEIGDFLNHGGSLADLKKAISDAGLKVVSVIALMDWATAEGREYQRVLEVCKRRMEQATALGSPYIVASPPGGTVDPEHITSRFGELFRLGRSIGVEPAMEFLGFVAQINSVASAWAIASGCGEPGAKVVADVFHMIRGGGSVDDLLMLEGSRLACFHINDVPAVPDPLTQTDHDRVMVGEGIADLPRVISNLRTIGYHGPLSLELFNHALWHDDAADVARDGLARIRSLLA
jgi:2-keto-myo-inositol isomerase